MQQNWVTETEHSRISRTLKRKEFIQVSFNLTAMLEGGNTREPYFIGWTAKMRKLSPNLMFPFMMHQSRYREKPAKNAVPRNPKSAASSPRNKLFKKSPRGSPFLVIRIYTQLKAKNHRHGYKRALGSYM